MDEIKNHSNVMWIIVVVCLGAMIGALHTPSATAGETLTRVCAQHELRCGVTEKLLGFSFQDANGRWRGFNVEFCRAVAVAVLGDPEKVSFIPVSAPNRFPALISDRIDLLARTATWTFGREAGNHNAKTLILDPIGVIASV